MLDKLALVKKYEPVLLFSKNGQGEEENFFPMAVEHFVAESRLYKHGTPTPIELDGGLTLESLAKIPPKEAEFHYLCYVSDLLIEQSPSVAQLFQGRGLSRFAVSGSDPAEEGDSDSDSAVEGKANNAQTKADDKASEEEWPEEWDEETATEMPVSYGLSDVMTETQQLPPEITHKAIEVYEPYMNFRRYPPVYYYRVFRNRGYVVIQYWFFYAFNDWGTSHGGMNDHEGDWESIMIFLEDPASEPVYAAFSEHISGPVKVRWRDAEKYNQTHPISYVACGSHANYRRQNVYKVVRVLEDYAEANSVVSIGPGQVFAWDEPVDLETAPWAYNFAGNWGAMFRRFGTKSVSQGVQGPKGPVWQHDMWERPVWRAKI